MGETWLSKCAVSWRRRKEQPVTVETIVVPDPGPGEVTVRVQACGVCHTDLHYREGGIGDDFPYLLGHEAAGIVEAVGDDVTSVAPGDFVVLNWRAVCGECRACRRGRPWYCFATHNASQKMTLADGTPLSPALGIGAFAEKTLVAAGQATKVDPKATPAAAGSARLRCDGRLRRRAHTGDVGRDDTVAVFGCGGVGDAAIAAARARRRAHDHRGRPRRAEARVGARSSARRTWSTRRRPTRSRPSAPLTDGERRRRLHRSRRPARGAEAGVLRA